MDKLARVKGRSNLLEDKIGDDISKVLSNTTTEITKVKFEIYGEEMIDKLVKSSGNSGRVYLPPNWVGCHVKVIRID